MIVGQVTRDLEAVARIFVRAPGGGQLLVEAVVDTGFNGFLTLAPATIAQLGLAFSGSTRVVLGDGAAAELSVYEAVVELAGRSSAAEVLETAGGALLGMSLLRNVQLRVNVVPDGDVSIEPLPPTGGPPG